MYSEIFNVVNYTQTRSRFDLNYDKVQQAPQFIMIDEGAAATFFADKRQYDDSKLFFEGQGYVCEAKHQHPEKRWQDVPIIVTSNTLPYVLCEDVKDKDMKVHRFAFHQRIAFTHLTKSYANTDVFPYDVTDLAEYMLYTLRLMRVNTMEDELDKQREYRQSLQSTVKKQRPQEAPADNKKKKDAFKTPTMKRPHALEQPILQPQKKESQHVRKRSEKKNYKKRVNPFVKTRPGVNTTLDIVQIVQGSIPRGGLRSQAAKQNVSAVSKNNMSEDDKPPEQQISSISPVPAFNLKSPGYW